MGAREVSPAHATVCDEGCRSNVLIAGGLVEERTTELATMTALAEQQAASTGGGEAGAVWFVLTSFDQ